MTLGTFQAVKFGGSKGASAASWVPRGEHSGSGVPGVGGRPKASGAERASNIDHTAIVIEIELS